MWLICGLNFTFGVWSVTRAFEGNFEVHSSLSPDSSFRRFVWIIVLHTIATSSLGFVIHKNRIEIEVITYFSVCRDFTFLNLHFFFFNWKEICQRINRCFWWDYGGFFQLHWILHNGDLEVHTQKNEGNIEWTPYSISWLQQSIYCQLHFQYSLIWISTIAVTPK